MPPSSSAVYNFKPNAMAGIFKGVCDTAAGTAAKVVTCPEFTTADQVVGAIVFVTFTYTNSAAVANLTLGINNEVAYPLKQMRNAAESNLSGVGYLRATMTYRFVFTGSLWVCDTDYDSVNTDYTLRTNAGSHTCTDTNKYYKILFSSVDNSQWVPFAVDTSSLIAQNKTVNQRPINPFGEIVYFAYTTTLTANSTEASISYCYRQNYCDLRYSVYNQNIASIDNIYPLTARNPVYVKCTPQSNGSAIIDADTPIVQTLPNTDDGKIYIFLGIAYKHSNNNDAAEFATKKAYAVNNQCTYDGVQYICIKAVAATNTTTPPNAPTYWAVSSTCTGLSLVTQHPVYYYKNGSIRLWTGQVATHVSFNLDSDGAYTMITTDV